MPPDAESSAGSTAADRLFDAFRAASNDLELLALAAATPDDALTALEQTVEAHLAAAEGDEATALRQRLESLRARRTEQAEAIRQMRDQMGELAQQLAAMPDDERRLLAFTAAESTADIMRLVAETADADLDRLEAAAGAQLAETASDERDALQRRLDDLRRWRAAEADARRILALLGEGAGQALADRLVAWIQTPDWDASQAFIRAHAAELLTDAATAAMTLLHMNNAGHEQVELHARLLAACCEQGIEAAYEQLRRELAQAEDLAKVAQTVTENPLLRAVVEFLGAEDDEQARQVLDSRRDLLLTAEARDLLEQLLHAAQQAGDAPAAERIAARLALVQAARLARYPTAAQPSGQAVSLGGETSSMLQTL
ncbi:MAG: hypothetical protein FJ011_27125, partial [Chloroflexi bacterium]|nr:hypothetical protein [Chloroflexota bacterium]